MKVWKFLSASGDFLTNFLLAYALGLDQKLISNYFQDAGYKTHLIGKW
jgi:arylsulfatase A-like enzyme